MGQVIPFRPKVKAVSEPDKFHADLTEDDISLIPLEIRERLATEEVKDLLFDYFRNQSPRSCVTILQKALESYV